MRPFLTREVIKDEGRAYDVCLRCEEFFPPIVPVMSMATELKADMLARRLNDLCEDFG